MQRFRFGPTGWSYKDWNGPFYPRDTPDGEMLERCARVFDTTEVNALYHAWLSQAQTRAWPAKTPDGFVFAVKAPGDVTHRKRLVDVEQDWARFRALVAPLREAGKLGPILVELPASFTYEKGFATLDKFLGTVAKGDEIAVELRAADWMRQETYRMLEAHGATLVWSEHDHGETPPIVTSSTIYLRLIGKHGVFTKFDHIQTDKRESMIRWRDRVENEGSSADRMFAFANNNYMGYGPETVARLAEVFGYPRPILDAAKAPLPIRRPPLPPGQKTFDSF